MMRTATIIGRIYRVEIKLDPVELPPHRKNSSANFKLIQTIAIGGRGKASVRPG